MRLSHCESYCAAPLCYIPCLPKSKDAAAGAADAVSAAPCPLAAAVEHKPPPVQKFEAVAAATAAVEAEKYEEDDKEQHEDGEKEAAAAPPPKSNLKKPNCGDDAVCAPKGNVKWLDLLGKDLTEVKEFEPREGTSHPVLYCNLNHSNHNIYFGGTPYSESGDSMDDEGISTCVCIIQ